MVAADSARARTMPMRSPLSSVTCALSIATSVPVPMAMPTSAAASAGASLTPSPAMATTRPSAAQPLDHGRLAVGQHLGLDLVDAEMARDRLRGGAVVAGEHHHAQPVAAQRRERGGRRLLHRIGDRDDAGELAVERDEDRGRAVAAQPLGLGFERRRSRCRARPGTTHCRARRGGARPCRPRPCRRASRNPMHARELDLALGRGRDDGRGERMLARALDARRKAAAPRSRRSPTRSRSRPPWACLRSACRSCRPRWCRPSPCARALRRS